MKLHRIIAAALASGSTLAWAQTVPNAGSLLNQVQPGPGQAPACCGAPSPGEPAAASAGVTGVSAAAQTFELKAITLKGNDTIPSDQLMPVVQGWIGKQVSMADLDSIAARLTRVYRERGYGLAQVVVPAQDVTSGTVEFSVLEGRLGQIRLDIAAGTPIRESQLRERLAALRVGQPLQQGVLERTMLLLSDLPGIKVGSTISAGEEPGTLDLTVNVRPGQRWVFSTDVDNFGAKTTGTWRLGALARLNSPFGIGDNLDLRLLGTQRLDTAYGRVGYEAPVDAYGTRVGIALARLNYTLGDPYSVLDATGEATVADLTVTHPLLRTREQSLLLRANLEYRDLIDNIGVASEKDHRKLTEGSLGLSYEGRDTLFGGGYNSADVQLLWGNLDIVSAQDRMTDLSDLGRHTNGNELRATFFANRLNQLTPHLSLFGGITGQWAATTLDSSSRFQLGGPHAVRAYSPSEGLVDEGFVATAEARYAINAQLTTFAFYDFGAGWYNATPRPDQGKNEITRAGAGLGLYWAAPYGISVQGTVAWRTTGPETTGDNRRPRIYVQLTKTF